MDSQQIEVVRQLDSAGINLMPVKADKIPYRPWEHLKSERIHPNGEFADAAAVAAICGKVSGGLGIMDFDTKYDITRNLMADFKARLNNPNLLKKIVMQKTPSGGYHFIFRSNSTEGNTKLARRPATEEELTKDPNAKVYVLIETRGEGGYFLIYPSNGYLIKHGDILDIPRITDSEREELFECARSFNSHYPKIIDYKQKAISKAYTGLSPFDDYNDRADLISLLESHGWRQEKQRGSQILFCRPGKKKGISGSYHTDLKTFYVYTSSSEFNPEKAYNHATVYAMLVHAGDYSEAAKDLYQQGYGDRRNGDKETPEQTEKKIDDINLSAIFSIEEVGPYLESLRNGTFKMGESTGSEVLDKHFRFKRKYFNIFNGYDNVGKSIFTWFLMLLTAKKYNWKWIVFTGENSKGGFYRRCIELLCCDKIACIDGNEYSATKDFITSHFSLIRNDESYTYMDILRIADKKNNEQKHDGILIDPYNSLDEQNNINGHQYHYKACLNFQHYTRKEDTCIYLNCHAVSYIQRKLVDGYLVAPGKADTEGGTKFASKADDFLTIHRLTNHKKEWNITQVHVRKVKEVETGGFPTMRDTPVLFQMLSGGIGFVDQNNINPLNGNTYPVTWTKIAASEPEEPVQRITPEKEPEQEQEQERLPF